MANDKDQQTRCWCGSKRQHRFCHGRVPPSNGLLWITGQPGVGKSTVAEVIHSRSNGQLDWLNWDQLLAKLMSQKNVSTGEEFRAINKLLLGRILDHARTKPSVVDCLAKPSLFASSQATAQSASIPLHGVYLTCDEKERSGRIERRSQLVSHAVKGTDAEDWPSAENAVKWDQVIDVTTRNANSAASMILRQAAKKMWPVS